MLLFCIVRSFLYFFFFFFNDTATTEIYTLSLHDALPILTSGSSGNRQSTIVDRQSSILAKPLHDQRLDRKSTRLNSSHANISYAVFCLKKKKKNKQKIRQQKELNMHIT